ncbi:hypothetical protein D3C71_1546220 [compost metagenome]
MVSTPLSVVMTTGFVEALVTSWPATVTPAMPASADTVTEPVTVLPEASITLLCAPLALPSLSSGVMTGGASVWPWMLKLRLALEVSPSASVTV